MQLVGTINLLEALCTVRETESKQQPHKPIEQLVLYRIHQVDCVTGDPVMQLSQL